MYKVYQVQIGDTLETIARKNNTTEQKLRELNSNLNNIMPGQGIIVPVVNDGVYETYVVQNGDTMYSIAKRYGVNVDDLLALNGVSANDYIYPNQPILVPKKNQLIYVTKPNDTFQTIVSKLQVSPETILEQNEKILLLPDQVIMYSQEGNI